MAEIAAMIEQREPLVHGVIGFMDGVALHSECYLWTRQDLWSEHLPNFYGQHKCD